MKKKLKSQAKAKLQNARQRAESYLLGILNDVNPTPSLIEAVQILQDSSLGVELTASILASQVRVAALRYQQIYTIQYRGFIVGCMLIGLIPQTDSRFKWFVRGSWNTKHKAPPKGVKYCAERYGLDAAEEYLCRHVLALYTAGGPREEDVTAGESDLLRVCEACRREIRGPKRRHLFIPESVFTSFNPHTEKRRTETFDHICSHNGDDCNGHQ